MDLALGFARYLVLDFSRHPSLLLVLGLLGAIVFAGMGHALGIDRLFWHEQRTLQLRAGVACALLVAKVGLVGYLLDERALGALPAFAASAASERARAAALYVILLAVPVAVVYAALAFGSRWAGRRPLAVPRAPFTLGAILGYAASVGLLLVLARLLPRGSTVPPWLARVLLLENVPASARPLHVLAALLMLSLSAEYVLYAAARRLFTPAMAICTLLGLTAGVVGFFEFRAFNPTAITLTLLGALALGGLPRYKVRLAALAGRYARRARLDRYEGAPAACAYPLVRSEDIPWRSEQGKRPLVLVCASGGGLRSALWTADVLSELEESLPGFAGATRIIAGASGGMVGASAWALSLQPPALRDARWGHTIARDVLLDRIGRDSLSATIKRMVFRDLPLLALPVANLKSRGEALEECWQANLGGALDATFGVLRDRERAGTLPSLVFSPMLVEDGRRLLISNLDLDFLAANRAQLGSETLALSRSSYELARLFPEEFSGFPVRTAARLSAAFPYVSPAVSLPTEPRRRVVDAGYYDNFGVSVCAAWLADCFCSDVRRAWIERNVSRILLVQLRDEVSP
ncbi:MAG: patatin-like phospholipase family protein, partial [Polyangiales bacterium]